MTLLAGGLAAGMVVADRVVPARWVSKLGFLYAGGTEGARAVLSTIAASMITTAGVVFSITIVALTLASSQFGPRLLRNFIRDRGNQIVLGTFIATFVYCLLVLRTVVSPSDGVPFVPHLSVTIGVGLAVTSLAVLIYFIHHIAVTIQADTVVASVGREFAEAVDRLFPSTTAPSEHPLQSELPPGFESESAPVAAETSGYIQVIDLDTLVGLASRRDLFIKLERRPGDFLIEGVRIARVWPRQRLSEDDRKLVRKACFVGPQRTQEQDVEFPVNQLVEIAVRALSPGINDPFTAVTCIDSLGAGLCRLASREFPPLVLADAEGKPRLLVDRSSFAGVADAAFDQIRQYGRESVAVTIRLLETIGEIALFARTEEQCRALRRQADMIKRSSLESFAEENDRREAAAAYRVLEERLEPGRVPAATHRDSGTDFA